MRVGLAALAGALASLGTTASSTVAAASGAEAADTAVAPLLTGFAGAALLAAAAVAMLTFAWLSLRRRRVQAATEAASRHEAVRRARRQLLDEADDPILASMGLGRSGRPTSEADPGPRTAPAAGRRSQPPGD